MKTSKNVFYSQLVCNSSKVNEFEKKFTSGNFTVNVANYNGPAEAALYERLKGFSLRASSKMRMKDETGTSKFLGWLGNHKKAIREFKRVFDCDQIDDKKAVACFEKYGLLDSRKRNHIWDVRDFTVSDIRWALSILPLAWTEGLAC